MSEYVVMVPSVDDMGSILPFRASASFSESAEENALSTINSMRDHDGLKRLARLPAGTKFDRVYRAPN